MHIPAYPADFWRLWFAGLATGIIDGFVYLGSTAQAFLYGATLPSSKIACEGTGGKLMVPNPEAAKIENWHVWPYAMIPVALIGLVLAMRLWNARTQKGGGH